ncbi:PEP-CTERM sorting domain-containing protein [Verrucomicrobiota bacterium]
MVDAEIDVLISTTGMTLTREVGKDYMQIGNSGSIAASQMAAPILDYDDPDYVVISLLDNHAITKGLSPDSWNAYGLNVYKEGTYQTLFNFSINTSGFVSLADGAVGTTDISQIMSIKEDDVNGDQFFFGWCSFGDLAAENDIDLLEHSLSLMDRSLSYMQTRSIPEPTTMALLGTFSAAMLMIRRFFK